MGNNIDTPENVRPEAENNHAGQPQNKGSETQPCGFKEDFVRRCRDNKTTRWVRFGIVTVIYILWTIWMSNAWLLLALPLLFDIYITGYIPFTWWKRSKTRPCAT